MMVMHKRTPIAACSSARGIPVTSSQIIFTNKDTVPPPYSTSFPNGKKDKDANLKHCTPIGIPIMVMHHRQPTRHQLSPLTKPPNINHKIFPRHPIMMHLFLYIFYCNAGKYHISCYYYLRADRIAYRILVSCSSKYRINIIFHLPCGRKI